MNSIVFPDKQPPITLVPPPVKKRGTIHVEGLLEDDVQSMFRLTVIMVSIMSGGLNLGYGISYLTLSVDTLFAVMYVMQSNQLSVICKVPRQRSWDCLVLFYLLGH